MPVDWTGAIPPLAIEYNNRNRRTRLVEHRRSVVAGSVGRGRSQPERAPGVGLQEAPSEGCCGSERFGDRVAPPTPFRAMSFAALRLNCSNGRPGSRDDVGPLSGEQRRHVFRPTSMGADARVARMGRASNLAWRSRGGGRDRALCDPRDPVVACFFRRRTGGDRVPGGRSRGCGDAARSYRALSGDDFTPHGDTGPGGVARPALR